jgi:NADPH:quinone reductase-like Zn-dependent oxidoreductase
MTGGDTMRAIVQRRSGDDPERVLRVDEIVAPKHGDGDVLVTTENSADLTALRALIDAGDVTPVIDHTYPLHEAPAGIARVRSGRARGTVVLAV